MPRSQWELKVRIGAGQPLRRAQKRGTMLPGDRAPAPITVHFSRDTLGVGTSAVRPSRARPYFPLFLLSSTHLLLTQRGAWNRPNSMKPAMTWEPIATLPTCLTRRLTAL
jgi:hypothetical protein